MNAADFPRPALLTVTQRLTGLTVSFRLRLLLGGLVVMLLCAAALFRLNSVSQARDEQLHAKVAATLDMMQSAQEAKDALVGLRYALAMATTGTDHPEDDRTPDIQAAIAEQLRITQAAVSHLQAIDPSSALSLETAADALSKAAIDGNAALMAGQREQGMAFFRQFPQLGAPAEAALDGLFLRQQQAMRQMLKQANDQQQDLLGWAQRLHVLILGLALLAAGMVLTAIFRPLQKLYRALGRVAAGEALHAAPVEGSDEFGQLGGALYDLSQLTSHLNAVAYHDDLTALPNRAQFERDVSALLATKAPMALLFADIDHFRTINDGYGHAFGDRVLKAVAVRLQWLLQGNTRLYRYSGDLFVLCITSGGPFAQADFRTLIQAEAERLRGRLAEQLALEDRSVPLCLSFGVALSPEDGNTTEALVSAADAAMFQAKQLGRNIVQFARGDHALKARRRLELADELRSALKTGAISPYFQPIVDLGSGRIVCAEALARWKHPTRGFVPPDEFIGIAEDSGQIDVLTEQLLRSACATAVKWQPHNGHPPPKLAFNLSARQVRQGVVEMIATVLAESGLPASRLEVEITESAIIERPETAERLLREVRGLGVSVALDDFGTGYSSLSYLLRFPIDKIKVDRSFVQQLGGQKQAGRIVAATISLAANLEILLVAEGVENVGQMVTLYELGCRQQQGWLFAKALPAEDFTRWALQAPLRLDAVVRAQAEASDDSQSAA